MIDAFLARLQRRAERRLVLFFLTLFLLFNTVLITSVATRLEAHPGGLGPLGQLLGSYSAAEADKPEGRLFYLLAEWTKGIAASLAALAFFDAR